MNKFIVIFGKKQVGKSETAKILRDLHTNSLIANFADPIKKFCVDILDIPANLVYGNNNAKNQLTQYRWDDLEESVRRKNAKQIIKIPSGRTTYILQTGFMTVREVMQVWGTDIMRNHFSKDIWAQRPFSRQWSQDIVIIDDGRMKNELFHAKKAGATLVRIYRDNGLSDSHSSELELDDMPDDAFHHIIYNDGTLEDLKNKAQNII